MRAAVFLLLPLLAISLSAQPAPAFDVASVRENRTLGIDGRFSLTPGRFAVSNLTLKDMVRFAYDVREYQVIGGPAWSAQTAFDVETVSSNTNALLSDVRLMLQQLLGDRFGLRVHREQREIRVYQLMTVRPEQRLGPKLLRSTVDCQRPPEGQRTCTSFSTAWSERGFAQTMPQLAKALEAHMREPVVDRTGLAGVFDYELRWGTPTGNADFRAGTFEDLAALPTALQEQLELKLEATRAPHEVSVIDTAERPSPN